MREHDNDAEECNCPICTAKRTMFERIEEINREAVANGAANCRRDLWLTTFNAMIPAIVSNTKNAISEETLVSAAAKTAKLAVIEFDKAFPEVKAAAMTEDR